MPTSNSASKIWQACLDRTKAREHEHKVFTGEDCITFRNEKRTSSVKPVSFEDVPITLPYPYEDPLFQRAAFCGLNAVCTICKRNRANNLGIIYTSDKKGKIKRRLDYVSSRTSHMLKDCFHVFHKSCLFSFPSEPYAPTSFDCCEFLEVTEEVLRQGWNTKKLEIAVGRIQE